MDEFGLSEYSNNYGDISKILKRFEGLPFVPIEHVADVADKLGEQLGGKEF